jgi:membrane-bound lytic murein transglycosylase MltF
VVKRCGYQEPGLNQDAKSPDGAIGVMQLMPATGKDMNVGDITKEEPNIQAGIKYSDLMMEKYYGKEPMDDLNKILFSFFCTYQELKRVLLSVAATFLPKDGA